MNILITILYELFARATMVGMPKAQHEAPCYCDRCGYIPLRGKS